MLATITVLVLPPRESCIGRSTFESSNETLQDCPITSGDSARASKQQALVACAQRFSMLQKYSSMTPLHTTILVIGTDGLQHWAETRSPAGVVQYRQNAKLCSFPNQWFCFAPTHLQIRFTWQAFWCSAQMWLVGALHNHFCGLVAGNRICSPSAPNTSCSNKSLSFTKVVRYFTICFSDAG